MIKKPIIFGLSGLILTKVEKDFFMEYPVFGFILFKRNIESKKQLQALTGALKDLYPDDPALIFIDQEGGKVARLKPPVIEHEYPPAGSFTDAQAVKRNYEDLMQDLKDLNIDSPCAPVGDLLHVNAHKIIGNRSFSHEVDIVVNFAKAAIEGIKSKGGIPVIKHIPGHGRAKSDSHLELPVVGTTLDELNKTDFEIFRRLAKEADYAMTAHVIYLALDKYLPVTLSKNSINFIKKEIGFKGKLMTDAIEMLALHPKINTNDKAAFSTSLANVASQSLEAGCDFVLHCTGDLEQMQEIIKVI